MNYGTCGRECVRRPPYGFLPTASRVTPGCRRTLGRRHRVMSAGLIVAIVLGVLGLLLLASAVRIVREYQRVVVFRLGRVRGA